MKTLKTLLFAALATIGFSFAAQAVDLDEIKTRLVPEDATDVVLDTEKGEISYPYNGDQIIIYAEPGSGHTFGVPDHVTEIEYLVVGGGGGGGGAGGQSKGGGGGGGGGVTNTSCAVAADSTLAITVGAGGAAGSGSTSGVKALGGLGGESKILLGNDEIAKALGGGGGAGNANNNAAATKHDGLCANGGGGSMGRTAGGVGTCFTGGKANSSAGGGGAGADAPGGAAASSGNDRAGDGGKGVYSWITGKEVCYGGGGGGGPGDGSTKYTAGLGGEGGGGNSGYYSGTTESEMATRTGSAGTDGLGGGGGGNGYDKSMNRSGGKGGSGVVIIRYTIPVAQTKVLVTAEGETSYGTPTPDYGEYDVGAYTTFTAPEYVQIDETTRAYCLGWSAQDKWGDPWIEFTPGCSATITEEEAFTLKWSWEIRRQVAATATEGGSVSGLGYFASGAVVELKATAESGYRFVAWENVPDGAVQQVDGTLTFTMGEEAVTALKAVFEDEVSSGVVVTFEGGNYGSPSPDYGTYTDYADGVERTYTNDEFAEISEGVRAYCMGYKVLDSDGQQLAAGTETSFKWTCAAGSHHTIVWVWEVRYLVTATAGEGGTVTGTDYYAAGEEVATVTATANGGYAFDGWAGDVPEGEENTNPLKLTVVDAPLAVSASFRQIPWGVALDYNKLNLPDVDQVSTNREACAVGETYTFKVPILIEKTAGAVRQRVIGYTVCTISEAGDGEETFYEGEVEDETNLVAAITYAEPVKVTWQWENDYYLTAGVNEGAMGSLVEDVSGWYANNSEVTVAIKDAKYFLSWSGNIAKADRAKQSVTLTMTKAMRATALFMTDSQDNVIANGDFEDMTGTTKVYKDFNSLLSGFWSGDEGTSLVYNGSGVITGSSGDWNNGKIEGLASAWLGSQNPNDSTRAIWTDFTVYEKGTYNLSYDVKRARDSGAASKFNVIAEVCATNGDLIQELDRCVISGTEVFERSPEKGVKGVYLKPGKYRLKFYHTSASGATGAQRVAAYDNVSLKLVQKKGLTIMLF